MVVGLRAYMTLCYNVFYYLGYNIGMKSHNYLPLEEMNETDRQINCLQKLTWQSREEARAASAYAAYHYGDGQDRPVAYNCRHCNMWHLSRRQYRD